VVPAREADVGHAGVSDVVGFQFQWSVKIKRGKTRARCELPRFALQLAFHEHNPAGFGGRGDIPLYLKYDMTVAIGSDGLWPKSAEHQCSRRSCRTSKI